MNNKIYGYVRVSSTDQNEDRQLHALIKENVPINNIFIDKRTKQMDSPLNKKTPFLLKAVYSVRFLAMQRLQ